MKSARDYSTAAPESASTADYGGSGGDAMAGPMAPPAEPMPMPASDDGEAERQTAMVEESKDMKKSEAPAGSTALGAPAPAKPARQEPPPGPRGDKEKPPTAGEGKEDGKEPQKQFARQIIYTAELVISVFKLEDAMTRAEALTLEVGGYVQQMSTGYFVLRIPAAHLRKVMDELGKLGVVEQRVLQAQDVTQEYFDLQTRIRVLKETQTQLIALLKQARNVEEALQVRRSLDAITLELEQSIGRMRLLENMIGFSTLTVRMSERGPTNAVPSSNDPFPWVDTLGVEATEWN